MSKHVIFLGAGASRTSGYPLAEQLRKEWLVSSEVLRDKLYKVLGNGPESGIADSLVRFDNWIHPADDALNLFRQGGFGTIDEFCYLIRHARDKEVKSLKEVLRFVFGLNDPEADFVKSDYYGFIQKLFEPENLTSLLKDITVLSFNYDPYLEWLLRRAYQTRIAAINKLNNAGLLFDHATDASITSGLSGGKSGLEKLENGEGFCLLKLHGSVAWPNSATNDLHSSLSPHCSQDDFFHPQRNKRIQAITDHSETPILFPWELFDDSGNFFEQNQFSLRDEVISHKDHIFRHGGRQPQDPTLHDIFRVIWSRARREVQTADRISFVGLSMNEYLNWGLRYLFEGRTGKIKLTITDRDSVGPNERGVYEPRSPTARVFAMRDKFRKEMGFGPPSIRTDFAEFITKDM